MLVFPRPGWYSKVYHDSKVSFQSLILNDLSNFWIFFKIIFIDQAKKVDFNFFSLNELYKLSVKF